MSEVRINLNEKVRFKLTDVGREIYLHQYDNFTSAYPQFGIKQPEPETDDDGYTSMQLHQFMHVFGPNMVPGQPSPIERLEIVYWKKGEWREQMKTYTQKEIAELIDVPYCDVSFAMYSVEPVAPASKPYQYESEDVKYALVKYYEKKREKHMRRVKKYDEIIDAVSRLGE